MDNIDEEYDGMFPVMLPAFIDLHEHMGAAIEAGFTKAQAFEFVKMMFDHQLTTIDMMRMVRDDED